MVEETEEVNADHETGTGFLNFLPIRRKNTSASTTMSGRRIPRPLRSVIC